jgi:hypothetical protein
MQYATITRYAAPERMKTVTHLDFMQEQAIKRYHAACKAYWWAWQGHNHTVALPTVPNVYYKDYGPRACTCGARFWGKAGQECQRCQCENEDALNAECREAGFQDEDEQYVITTDMETVPPQGDYDDGIPVRFDH